MRGPNELGGLSDDETKSAKTLESEIETHFRETPDRPYSFDPHSTGAGEFSDRVKREVIRRAKSAGWIASDLDAGGGFTVKKP